MTPYVTKYISGQEIALFEQIRSVVNKLPDLDLGRDNEGQPVPLTCHMLARAVARVFTLRFADGFFYPKYPHSWVLTPDRHIIDVYPIAVIGGPILIEGNMMLSPSKQYYLKAPREIYRGRFGNKEFRRSVNRIARELKASLT